MTWLKRTSSNPRFWLGLFLFYFVVIFARAIRVHPNGDTFATPLPVWGDWPIHFTMASAMAYRSLFLTSSPLLIFAPFHYPFLPNLISALLIRAGVPFFECFRIPSLLFTLGGIVLLFLLLKKFLQKESAAMVALTIYLFNGGFGFVWLLRAAVRSDAPLKMLLNPPPLVPLAEPYPLIWDSVIRGIILPQRSFQLGFLLGLGSLYLLWTAITSIATHRTWRWWVGGILAGLLPVSHLHSFAAVGVIAAVWMGWDLTRYRKKALAHRMGLWARYGCPAVGMAAYQLLFLSIVSFGTSVAKFVPGWYVTTSVFKWIWFWILNWGFTPFLAAWGFWCLWKNPTEKLSRDRLVVFTAPFLVLFAILNLFILQPWIWDNTKILAWVSVAVSALAGWAVVDLWGRSRAVAVTLCVLSCLSGGIEAVRLIHPKAESFQLYTREEVELADWVRANSEPTSVWLTAAHHNNWVFNLTGRQVLMTYDGWLWSHGYDYGKVKNDLETLLKDPTREDLLDKYGVSYASIGPIEKYNKGADPLKFEKLFEPVLKTANYTLFRRKPPTSLSNGSSVNP